jgi:hypothetical protein
MKKIFIAFIMVLFMWGLSGADSITLTSPENLAVPTSSKIGDWYIDYISAKNQRLSVRYYWADSNGQPISLNGNRRSWQIWTCRERPAQLEADCTDVGVPYSGCTGAGTGTGLDPGDSCFTDVFGFTIRTEDVGTSIGVGLRILIWNRMKADILTGGNNGTFD